MEIQINRIGRTVTIVTQGQVFAGNWDDEDSEIRRKASVLNVIQLVETLMKLPINRATIEV